MDKKLIVPDHWTQLSLVDDFKYIKTGVEPYENIKKYYSTGSIKEEKFTPEGEYTFHERPSRANRLVREGDILQARMQGTNKALLINKELDKQLFSTGFFQVRPFKDTYNSKLLYYYFSSNTFLNKKDSLCSGSTQSALNDTEAKKLFIPLPPLPEQHRIVNQIEAHFSELENSIKSLKTAKAQLKNYRESVLKQAFEGKLTQKWRVAHTDELESAESLLERIKTERKAIYEKKLGKWEVAVKEWEANAKEGKKPVKPKKLKEMQLLSNEELAELPGLPSDWLWCRPEDIASAEDYALGIGPFGSNLKVVDYRDNGVPLIFVRNITNKNFDLDPKFISEEKYLELIPHTVKPNDLVITKMGEPPGDCTIYPETRNVAVLTSDCLKFRVWNEYANRQFYSHVVNSQITKKQLVSLTKGVAQKKISLDRFKSIKLPLCSTKEQHQIVNEIESRFTEADGMEKAIEESLQKAEYLQQSILKKAFEGKLVIQNPEDEPVNELLKRVEEEKKQYLKELKAQKKKPKLRVEQKKMEILETLEKRKNWIKTQELFEQYTDRKDTDIIEGFYQKLRELLNSGDIEVKREAEVDWFKIVKK